MTILNKFIKLLKHTIHNVLHDTLNNIDFSNVYETIYKICSSKFGMQHHHDIQSIYVTLFDNIKSFIEEEVSKCIYDELDLNVDLKHINTIWYKYINKIYVLEEVFLYMYKDAVIYIDDCILKTYVLNTVYIKLWDTTILYKLGASINTKIESILNNVRENKNNLLTDITKIQLIELFKTYYKPRYINLIDFIYRKGVDFYNQLFKERCFDLQSFNYFILHYKGVELNIIDKYEFEYKNHKDYRLHRYVTDLTFSKISDINQFLEKHVITVFFDANINNFNNNYNKDDLTHIKLVFELTKNYGLPEHRKGLMTIIIKTLYREQSQQIDIGIDIDFYFKLIIIFKELNLYDTYGYLYSDYLKIQMIEDKDIETTLNTKINKMMQKNDLQVNQFPLLLKAINYDIFCLLYQKSLYKRVLIRNIHLELEISVILSLKQHKLFSRPLDVMIKDIQMTKSLDFIDSKLNITIGSKGMWPVNQTLTKIPDSFKSHSEHIESNYKTKYPNRHLSWYSVNAIIKFKSYELQLGCHYVDLLNRFNDNDSIKKESICYKTLNKKKIDNLVSIKLLIDEGDSYRINDEFTYSKKKINLL